MEALDARNSAEEKTRIRDYDRSQDNMLGDPPAKSSHFFDPSEIHLYRISSAKTAVAETGMVSSKALLLIRIFFRGACWNLRNCRAGVSEVKSVQRP